MIDDEKTKFLPAIIAFKDQDACHHHFERFFQVKYQKQKPNRTVRISHDLPLGFQGKPDCHHHLYSLFTTIRFPRCFDTESRKHRD